MGGRDGGREGKAPGSSRRENAGQWWLWERKLGGWRGGGGRRKNVVLGLRGEAARIVQGGERWQWQEGSPMETLFLQESSAVGL